MPLSGVTSLQLWREAKYADLSAEDAVIERMLKALRVETL